MATPPRVPAGWYDDPSARHERRYWDGTDWTAQVSDAGIAATDQLGTRPPPTSEHLAGSSPAADPAGSPPAAGPAAAGPDAVAPAQRKRRAWAVPVIAVAAVVVLGLLAGLVIWAPWKRPPLLRPTGLTAGSLTTDSVAFHWSSPATGPLPDKYLILYNGEVIGSVPGTVTSYRTTGLAPDTPYQYRVAAERGGKRSAPSSVLTMHTATPPVSAARWQGSWTVTAKITHGSSTINGPKHFTETWLASPQCATGPCSVRLSVSINGHSFKVTMARAGAVYRGKTTKNIFPCGTGSNSVPVKSGLTIRVKLTKAQVENEAWTAAAWHGIAQVSSPYTASGNFYCPAAHQTIALTGGP